MKGYLLKRLLCLIPVMLGVSIITFGLINLAPGDPAELMLRAEGVEPFSVDLWNSEADCRGSLFVREAGKRGWLPLPGCWQYVPGL